jgi:hypothetical protein
VSIAGKQHRLAMCASRAEAAAAHDLGLIWKRLHGKGGRHARGLTCTPFLLLWQLTNARMPVCAEHKKTPTSFNFPQLLSDEQLRGRLQGVPDIAALKAAVADWLQQQWPQQEAGLLAARATALAR